MRKMTFQLAAAVSCLVVSGVAHADSPREAAPATMADVAVLGGLVVRTATSDQSLNPDGIGYEPTVGWGVQARAYALPWLRASGYYVHSVHGVTVPSGAARITYDRLDLENVDSFVLGFRLEPTLRVTERLEAWLSAGAGWGRLTTDKMTVFDGSRSYIVQERAGVFVELPVGLGIAYTVVPSWLALRAEATIGPNIKQSGTLFENVSYVDTAGQRGSVGPMPTQSLSSTILLGASVLL